MFSDLSIEFDELGMHLDVPFVPTGEGVIRAMLELGGVDASDVLYDLGSGDGRIVVAAARDFGAQAVGVEIDSGRVALAQAYAEEVGVADRVCFLEDDLLEVDISPASVVTMFLLPHINLALRPRLLTELRPGTRIVSHTFDMGDWQPDQRIPAKYDSIFLWVIPARVAGIWHWQTVEGRHYQVELEQRYQQLSGEVWVDGQLAELEAARLWGDLLELVVLHEGDYEPESIILHCRDDRLVVVSENQQGAVARRVGSCKQAPTG